MEQNQDVFTTLEERANTLQEDTQDMTSEQLVEFMQAFSGVDAGGFPRAVLSFMLYDVNSPEDDPERENICLLSNAVMNLTIDLSMPMFYVFDIAFHSCDDYELGKLWKTLEEFRKKQSENTDKVYAFYMNMVETASTTDREGHIFAADLLNPILFYLTREKPTTLARDEIREDGDLQGGNVIRMLIPVDFVTFRVEEGLSISEIQAEVEREQYADQYAMYRNENGEFYWEE